MPVPVLLSMPLPAGLRAHAAGRSSALLPQLTQEPLNRALKNARVLFGRLARAAGSSKKRQGGKFCREHRARVFVPMYHKTCMYAEGCSTIASFGSKDEGLPKYCAAHKNAGHVLVYVSSLFSPETGSRSHAGSGWHAGRG